MFKIEILPKKYKKIKEPDVPKEMYILIKKKKDKIVQKTPNQTNATQFSLCSTLKFYQKIQKIKELDVPKNCPYFEKRQNHSSEPTQRNLVYVQH